MKETKSEDMKEIQREGESWNDMNKRLAKVRKVMATGKQQKD